MSATKVSSKQKGGGLEAYMDELLTRTVAVNEVGHDSKAVKIDLDMKSHSSAAGLIKKRRVARERRC